MTPLWVLLVFAILIIPHEFGHFIASRILGVKVYEFSIGFGPKIFEVKGKKTKYVIRMIPLGGFVRMAGMDDLGEEAIALEEEKFTNKAPWKRFLILFSGSLMNFILAISLFCFVFLLGVSYPVPRIKEVLPGKPASTAGFQPMDKILSINGIKIENVEDAIKIIREAVPSPQIRNAVKFEIERDGRKLFLEVIPEWEEERKGGFIGIAFDYEIKRYSFFSAIKESFSLFLTVIALTFSVLGMLFKGAQGISFAGPIGIAKLTGEAVSAGYQYLLNFMGFFSIQLGIFNLIPFPALDGGRILFILIEKIRGKPLETKKEETVHWIGLLVLLFLMLLVTFFDIQRLSK
ncbi:MAG: RIP metalloprotease RseP [Dictyoglomaceae bacterium]|nr:RIP metalloprotease RseP [Dictyoglomaceae bacterium]